MCHCKSWGLVMLLALLPGIGFAQTPQPEPQIGFDSTTAPDVILREEEDRTIEEYRVNGILYAVKVTPKNGKPYFLVRADGQDNFVHAEKPSLRIPSWKLFEW